MGRPRTRLERDDYERLTSLAAKGRTLPEIAFALGLSIEALRKRLATDRRAQAALAEGLAESEARLLSLLRERAEGGDTQAAMFLLRPRRAIVRTMGPAVMSTRVGHERRGLKKRAENAGTALFCR
jgi:hypothetical protein